METPTITGSSYASSATSGLDWLKAADGDGLKRIFANAQMGQALGGIIQQPKEPIMSNARIVKVFIADSNENLPLASRVLHSGDEQLTDLTDQELFFEVPIAEILAKHNETRKTTVDKKQAEKFGRDIFLEPARIRDLKMVVVTVAQF